MALSDVTNQFEVGLDPFALSRLMDESCTPVFEQNGWSLELLGPERLSWESTYRPTWAIVLAVLLFPIGLLFLLFTRQRSCYARLVPTAVGARLTITGSVPIEAALAIQLAIAGTEPPSPGLALAMA
jgi:hypothetical protein